jgi:hypothetical protein
MVRYLKDVLGIQYIQIDPDELSNCAASPQDNMNGPEIKRGDWVWLGEGLQDLPIFEKMIQALWDHLSKKGFLGNIILLDAPYSDILNADFDWPEELTLVCHEQDFHDLFRQVLPEKSRIILIPHPAHFEKQPDLKKVAWQALTKEL